MGRIASVQVAVIAACGAVLAAAVTAVGAIACVSIQGKGNGPEQNYSCAGPHASAPLGSYSGAVAGSVRAGGPAE